MQLALETEEGGREGMQVATRVGDGAQGGRGAGRGEHLFRPVPNVVKT